MAATPFASPLVLLAFFAFLNSISFNEALRTGAPALACINLRPIHGLHRAKPASASQFFVSQSSLSYSPGQNITVEVATHSQSSYFRGFIIQAYDPISGNQIGHFLPSSDSKPIDSCSAATHRNNLNKKHVSLTWLPPAFFGQPEPSQPAASSPSASNLFNANQWMNMRSPIRFSFNNGNNKRQLPPVVAEASSSEQANSTTAAAAAAEPTPTSIVIPQPETASSNQGSTGADNGIVVANNNNNGLRQVRFTATIVVTYEEFYTGFESSDQRFEKFGYATSGNH